MADRKIVIYKLDPDDPEKRKKLGTFELGDDGKVQAEFDNPGLEWEVRQGFFDAKEHKHVGLSGGERFMELLAQKYGPSSFVAVEKS
jgi:hypothetical protein